MSVCTHVCECVHDESYFNFISIVFIAVPCLGSVAYYAEQEITSNNLTVTGQN